MESKNINLLEGAADDVDPLELDEIEEEEDETVAEMEEDENEDEDEDVHEAHSGCKAEDSDSSDRSAPPAFYCNPMRDVLPTDLHCAPPPIS